MGIDIYCAHALLPVNFFEKKLKVDSYLMFFNPLPHNLLGVINSMPTGPIEKNKQQLTTGWCMPCQFWWGAFDFKKNSGVIGTVRTSPNVVRNFR